MAKEMWRLPRTRQCAKCPWRTDVNPHDIPNGYSVENHKNLDSTIATGLESLGNSSIHVMACHETNPEDETPCLGWLANQLGPGNNLGLRMAMRHCENIRDVELVGDQHETFEATIPEDRADDD
jgi:hypothetical protein